MIETCYDKIWDKLPQASTTSTPVPLSKTKVEDRNTMTNIQVEVRYKYKILYTQLTSGSLCNDYVCKNIPSSVFPSYRVLKLHPFQKLFFCCFIFIESTVSNTCALQLDIVEWSEHEVRRENKKDTLSTPILFLFIQSLLGIFCKLCIFVVWKFFVLHYLPYTLIWSLPLAVLIEYSKASHGRGCLDYNYFLSIFW